MAGLDCGTLSSISWPVLRAGVDVALSIDDDFAVRAMRALARERVVAGESGAAGVAALLAWGLASACTLSKETRVLVLSTEGATDPASYSRLVTQLL